MSFFLTKGVLQQQANRAGGGVPTDGLISYWKLDETSGPVVDSWGNNDGTNKGALRGVEGKVGNAFEFDGSSHVETEDIQIIPETGDFTINGWVNVDNLIDGNAIFVGCGVKNINDLYFYANSASGGANNEVRVFMRDSGGEILLGPDIRGVGWTMLSLSRNSNEFTLRVNKEIVDIKIASGRINKKLWIGACPASDGSARFRMKGKEDEIGIWERALTDEEITQLYNEGKGTTL